MDWLDLPMELASQCNPWLFSGAVGLAAGLILWLAYAEWRCSRARQEAKYWMAEAERSVRFGDKLLRETRKICESLPGWKEASDEYEEILAGRDDWRRRKLH